MIWHTLMVFAQETTAAGPFDWAKDYGPGFVICAPVVVYLERKCVKLENVIVELTKAYHAVVEKDIVVLDRVHTSQEAERDHLPTQAEIARALTKHGENLEKLEERMIESMQRRDQLGPR